MQALSVAAPWEIVNGPEGCFTHSPSTAIVRPMFPAASTPRSELPPVREAAVADRTGLAAQQPPAAPEDTSAPGPKTGGGARNAFFDNAKYLAIVLVAMGHAWEPLTDGSRAA